MAMADNHYIPLSNEDEISKLITFTMNSMFI
jgi:hypothetical protein